MWDSLPQLLILHAALIPAYYLTPIIMLTAATSLYVHCVVCLLACYVVYVPGLLHFA